MPGRVLDATSQRSWRHSSSPQRKLWGRRRDRSRAGEASDIALLFPIFTWSQYELLAEIEPFCRRERKREPPGEILSASEGPAQIFTSCLPKFSPLNNPMNALGAFSKP